MVQCHRYVPRSIQGTRNDLTLECMEPVHQENTVDTVNMQFVESTT